VGICEALKNTDYVTSTHRGHGHCLAKGATPDRMFAELLGKEAGYCRGKGGSMHIADPATGNLGANAIVGGSAGIATGAGVDRETIEDRSCGGLFFWRGRAGAGRAYEVMNLAALYKLPVIYVCENNLYTEYTHFSETTAGDILARGTAFGVHAESVDGQDVRAVHAVAQKTGEPGHAKAKGLHCCFAIHIVTPGITSGTSIANITVRSRKSRSEGPSPLRARLTSFCATACTAPHVLPVHAFRMNSKSSPACKNVPGGRLRKCVYSV